MDLFQQVKGPGTRGEGGGRRERLTNQQLVDKDPDGPPVALPAVDTITALRLEHLRGDVVRRAHGGVTVHHSRLPGEREHTCMLQHKRSTEDKHFYKVLTETH